MLGFHLLCERHAQTIAGLRNDALAAVVEAELHAEVILEDLTRNVRAEQTSELLAFVRVGVEGQHGTLARHTPMIIMVR